MTAMTDPKERAFEKVVREHKGTIYTVCYMFAKDRLEAEDLFQETLVNLWKGFGRFRGDCRVGTWIWRVALNTCISADRKKKRRPATCPLEMAGDLFSDTDEESVQIRSLRQRIQQLDLADRALVLLWLENLSYEEIGLIIGISPKLVSVRLVRIKEKLIRTARSES